jgi:hypothetical protein
MSFTETRDRMNNAIFARLGEVADWTGIGSSVRVIEREQDEDIRFGQASQILRTKFLRVRRSEVPSPIIGDNVQLAVGREYRVIAEPVLLRHLVWLCEVQIV